MKSEINTDLEKCDWSWSEMLCEFRALGGIADNIERRMGIHGMGLFPVEKEKPVEIRVPAALLVPVKWITADDDELVISSESGIDVRVREFFTRYQRNFSWGRDGRKDALAWQSRFCALPENVRLFLRQNIYGALPSDASDGNYPVKRYFESRCINYCGQKVVMPLMELVNHSSTAPGYDLADGVGLKGRFGDEIYVGYGDSDPVTRYFSYGIVNPEQCAFSMPAIFRLPQIKLRVERAFSRRQGPTGVANVLPTVERISDEVRISFLLLGNTARPGLPRAIFRRIFPNLSADQVDEVFQITYGENLKLLTSLLGLLDACTDSMSCDLRKVVRLQFGVMASSYGVRNLESLLGS